MLQNTVLREIKVGAAIKRVIQLLGYSGMEGLGSMIIIVTHAEMMPNLGIG